MKTSPKRRPQKSSLRPLFLFVDGSRLKMVHSDWPRGRDKPLSITTSNVESPNFKSRISISCPVERDVIGISFESRKICVHSIFGLDSECLCLICSIQIEEYYRGSVLVMLSDLIKKQLTSMFTMFSYPSSYIC